MPIIKAGPPIPPTDNKRSIKENTDDIALIIINIVNTIPKIINNIPPKSSYFHEIINKAIKMNVGMLCMRNPTTVPQKSRFISNTSKEKIVMKQMNIMDNILGVQ